MPKPRMTQRDAWLKPPRKCVQKYRIFETNVVDEWAKAGATKFNTVTLSCKFYVFKKYRVDLSNMIKSVEDALLGYAWVDDNIDIIQMYGGMYGVRVDRLEDAMTIIDIRGT